MHRITVDISEAAYAALRLVMEREEVPMAEALRRLVGYGELVYRSDQIDGAEVLVRTGHGQQRIVLINE